MAYTPFGSDSDEEREGYEPLDAEAEAEEVASVDPQLADKAAEATEATPESFLGKIKDTVLGGVGKGVQLPVIKQTLQALGTPTAAIHGYIDESQRAYDDDAGTVEGFGRALKGAADNVSDLWGGREVRSFGDTLEEHYPSAPDDNVSKWAKRIGGFAGEMLDPTIPLTAGAGAVGRPAAKAAGVAALKKATPEIGEEVAEAATKRLLADSNLATNVEAIAKEFPEAAKVLPKVTQGGIRYGKEGPTIVPGSVTRKVSAPVGKAVRKVTNPVVDAFTPLKMQRKSPEGWFATQDWRDAGNVVHGLQTSGQKVARDVEKAFRDQDPDVVRQALETGIGADEAQTAAAQAARDWMDEFWGTARESSDLSKREGYVPRQFTPEFLKKRSGESVDSPGVEAFLDSLGGFSKERGLGDMSLDEAEAFLRRKHNLPEDFAVYERDPAKSIASYMISAPERLKTQRFGEGLRDRGYLRKFSDVRDDTVPEEAAVAAKSQFYGDEAYEQATKDYFDQVAKREHYHPTIEEWNAEEALRKARDAARKVAKTSAQENKVVGHVPGGMARVGDDYLAPREIADFIANEMKPKPFGPQAFRDFNRAFKSGVTAAWPGFHSRNLQGSQVSNLLRGGGVQGLRLWRTLSRAADDEVLPELGGRTAGEVRELLANESVLGGGKSQLFELAGEGKGFIGRQAEGRVNLPQALEQGGGITRALKYPEAMMGATERAARTPAYLHALKQYDDPYTARNFAAQAHGDYSELSPFERKLREFVPFEKWMRTNIPHQAQMLMERPSAALAPYKATRGLEGNDREQMEGENFLTDQQADSNAFALGDNLVSLDLPSYDLNKVLSPSGLPDPSALISNAHPLAQGILKIVFKQDPYFGSDINDWQTATGPIRTIATALSKIPGSERVVQRSKGGELRVASPFKTLLSSMPTSRAMSTINTLSGDKPLEQQLGALLGGVRVEEPSPYEGYNREGQLDDLFSELYRRGYADDLDSSDDFGDDFAGGYRPFSP